MSSLSKLSSRCSSLFGSLWTSKIYKMELGVHNFLSGFNSWSRLNMKSIDAMRSRWMGVELMSCISSIDLSFEKLIESIFLTNADVHGQILNCYSTSGIVLDWQLLSLDTNIFWRGQKVDHLLNKVRIKKVTYLFIVDFYVTDSDGDGLVKLVTNLMIHLLNRSWNNTPLLIVVSKS